MLKGHSHSVPLCEVFGEQHELDLITFLMGHEGMSYTRAELVDLVDIPEGEIVPMLSRLMRFSLVTINGKMEYEYRVQTDSAKALIEFNNTLVNHIITEQLASTDDVADAMKTFRDVVVLSSTTLKSELTDLIDIFGTILTALHNNPEKVKQYISDLKALIPENKKGQS